MTSYGSGGIAVASAAIKAGYLNSELAEMSSGPHRARLPEIDMFIRASGKSDSGPPSFLRSFLDFSLTEPRDEMSPRRGWRQTTASAAFP
jgi:hypothetical protein